MGMFDSVYARCQSCGTKVEFQSKSGDCTLAEYDRHKVPKSIALALNGSSEKCSCGKWVTLSYGGADSFVRMEVS